MRFLIVPLSFKESMVYCQRTTLPLARAKPRIDDRLATRASTLWNNWQKSDAKWKQSIVRWTNSALEKISYDEWSLKTIPAQSAILRKAKAEGEKHVAIDQVSSPKELEQIVVEYPSNLMTADQANRRLLDLAYKGTSHHRKYMWLSAIGAPLTLPMAALPVVPNIPGFYLLFRAWSHWKALEGAKHLQSLTKDDHLEYQPNKLLNNIAGEAEATKEAEDHVLLQEDDIDGLAEGLGAKEMAPELHRALHQVRNRVNSK